MSLSPDAPTASAARLGWVVPAAAVLLLLALAAVLGNHTPGTAKTGTSYDASHDGFRAAYLLLEDLGYPVTRSKRPTGGSARFVLAPEDATPADAGALDDWVRRGGTLVLATEHAAFARPLGMELRVEELEEAPESEPATGGGATRLAAGSTYVSWPKHAGQVWARAGDRPAVTVYERGRGEIWLMNRPEILTNRRLREGDNSVFLCRMAEDVLRRRPGELAFDEFFHGMRERPGVMELLFRPPALWVTLQAILVLALVLWREIPRFGSLRPLRAPSRRSKDEFLSAMASLLERKHDYAGAYGTVHDNLMIELARELGLPPGAPPERIREAARGRPAASALDAVLARAEWPRGSGRAAFVHALNDLEAAHHEFFDRHHR